MSASPQINLSQVKPVVAIAKMYYYVDVQHRLLIDRSKVPLQ